MIDDALDHGARLVFDGHVGHEDSGFGAETNKVTIINKTITVESTIDLLTYKPSNVNDIYETSLQELTTSLDDGIYYYYLSDGGFA